MLHTIAYSLQYEEADRQPPDEHPPWGTRAATPQAESDLPVPSPLARCVPTLGRLLAKFMINVG
jgi:hypothetical protein